MEGESLHGRLPVDWGEWHMRVALVDERRVNLIGEYTHVVLGGQVGQSQHFFARQYLADQVVAGCTAPKAWQPFANACSMASKSNSHSSLRPLLSPAPSHSIGISRTSTPYRRGAH